VQESFRPEAYGRAFSGEITGEELWASSDRVGGVDPKGLLAASVYFEESLSFKYVVCLWSREPRVLANVMILWVCAAFRSALGGPT